MESSCPICTPGQHTEVLSAQDRGMSGRGGGTLGHHCFRQCVQYELSSLLSTAPSTCLHLRSEKDDTSTRMAAVCTGAEKRRKNDQANKFTAVDLHQCWSHLPPRGTHIKLCWQQRVLWLQTQFQGHVCVLFRKGCEGTIMMGQSTRQCAIPADKNLGEKKVRFGLLFKAVSR